MATDFHDGFPCVLSCDNQNDIFRFREPDFCDNINTMDNQELKNLLIRVAEGELTPTEAVERLKTLPYEDMGFAKLDMHRELRTGRAEVIFGIGKTPEQVAVLLERLSRSASLAIATKVGPEHYAAAKAAVSEGLAWHETAKMLVWRRPRDASDAATDGQAMDGGLPRSSSPGLALETSAGNPALASATVSASAGACSSRGRVAVVAAGTADIPIAEEAALTVELYGCESERFFDVGVAGIHRLLDKVGAIRAADVVIAVAGMEGALASVVGGLVSVPVIAVPTSIGYGSSMGGLTALLAMLNSCSLGVSVVNIDNGFGAGYLASLIARRAKSPEGDVE
jgi:NCAIR mutase (PurE)-related protein